MLLVGIACLWMLAAGISRRVLGSLLNPITVFATAWLACAALAASPLVRLDAPSAGDQLLMLTGIGLTLAGGFVATCGASRRAGTDLRRPLPTLVVVGIAAAAFTGFALLVAALHGKVSLWIYLVAPGRVEELGFQAPGIGYLNLLHIVLPALLVVQGRRSRRGRWLWFTAALLSLATTPFAGIKAYFVQAVLTLAFASLYETGRVAVRTQVLAATAVALVVFSYFVFYDEFFDDRYVDFVAEGVVDVPRALEPLARPLVYATGPLATFGPFTRFQDDVYYGAATFRSVSRVASAFEPVRMPPFNGAYYDVPVPFNTYSVLREYYEDGREAGVVVLSFLAGLLAQTIFLAARRKPSVPLVILAAYVTSAQALAPFAGFLSAPQATYFAALLMGVHVLASAHGRFQRRAGFVGRGDLR